MLLIVRCICICLYRKGLERNGIAKAERAEKPQSGVKGVTWHLQTKSWKVSLRINDKQLHGGYFKLNKGLSWHRFMYLAIVKSGCVKSGCVNQGVSKITRGVKGFCFGVVNLDGASKNQ